MPGIYEYSIEYQDTATGRVSRSLFPGTFLVEPRLRIPQSNVLDSDYKNGINLLPLDAITILTVIPKWMPSISNWLSYFHSFANTGYNMVHFAPINKRGISNSPYSIYDQLAISDDLFDLNLPEPEKEEAFRHCLEQILNTCGILSVTDIVWNHTACNSLWLEEHPEAGYNLKNSPHLRAANELDEAILEFSETITATYGLDSQLKSETALQEIMNLLKNTIIPAIRLWEFYVLDVKGLLFTFAQYWNFTEHKIPGNHRFKDVNIGAMTLKQKADFLYANALLVIHEGHRFAKGLDTAISIAFIQKDLADMNAPCTLKAAMQEYESIMNEINLDFYREYDADYSIIIAQICNRARYLRVEEHGPRLGPISRSYFEFSNFQGTLSWIRILLDCRRTQELNQDIRMNSYWRIMAGFGTQTLWLILPPKTLKHIFVAKLSFGVIVSS